MAKKKTGGNKRLRVLNYLLHSADQATLQPHLNAMGMMGRVRQYFFHDSPCSLAGALVAF
jgi:hypothetical protein